MKIIRIIQHPDPESWSGLLARPEYDTKSKEQQVSAMLDDLKNRNWDAVRDYTQRFDGYDPLPAAVPEEWFSEAEDLVSPRLKEAIALAAANIRIFHEAQRRAEIRVQVREGIECYQRWFPIERVGLYVPGGTAPLISTVLMLALPAAIAGCEEVVMCTPANREGRVDPAILYAARYCGVKRIFRLGGVQAIAAMAYGLGEVPSVYKIFGPGNSWVTMAKQLVTRDGVAIDLPAGPSEVAVMADDSCNPAWVAADLLSQAEHGSDSQSILVTDSIGVAGSVAEELEKQVAALPRKEVAIESLKNSCLVVLADTDEMVTMINQYAPEHLIITTRDYRQLAGRIRNAGSVFLGHLTPESSGDYASGTNHTLPTSGYAKAYSGLSLDAFMKSITFQELDQRGLSSIGDAVITMARAEGLEGHARAAELRMTMQRDPDGVEIFHRSAVMVKSLVRKNILNLKPYSSARDEYAGRSALYLDANENPNETGLNRYPDPRQRELAEKIAGFKGVGVENLFLGNGSDEAIDLLFRIFCEPRRDRMLTLAPTYGMYSVCARIQDVEVDELLLNPDFSLNPDALLEAVRWNTRLVFICSPNNPTGKVLPLEVIRYLAERINAILVIDEAYIDFSGGPSSLELLAVLPNLVVLQTFSKAWGLAGVRMGMAFSSPEIIGLMNKVKSPYNVNVLSAATVMEKVLGELQRRIGDEGQVEIQIREIIEQRAWLTEQLQGLPAVVTVFESEANFLLVRMTDAADTYQYLTGRGIVVRDRSSQPRCENCLRFTVGTPSENKLLIEALKSYTLHR